MIAIENEYLGYEEIKTIVCGIEGLHLESFMQNMQAIMTINGQKECLNLGNQKNFSYFKKHLKHFAITKEQLDY